MGHSGGRAAGLTAAILAIGVAAISFTALSPGAALVSCLLGCAMLAIAAVDAQRFTIPDVLSLPAIPLGLLLSGDLLDPGGIGLVSLDHVIGAAVGGAGFWLVRAVYTHLRGREGLGLGDVKLAAAAGAWTGWEHLGDVMLLAAAGALSLVLSLVLLRRQSPAATDRIPFGTFLAPAIWVVWALRAYALGL